MWVHVLLPPPSNVFRVMKSGTGTAPCMAPEVLWMPKIVHALTCTSGFAFSYKKYRLFLVRGS
uniref:Uncharacterized protein n=1 Tax=Arundo donax TaxID=35708 RepID=A0A0A8Z739_ARUDO